MSGYIWYSAGSDVSGPKLGEALGFSHGKKTPKVGGDIKVLVGWGCKAESRDLYDPEKIKAAVAAGNLRVINYPAAISLARNKLSLLHLLQGAGVATAGFVDVKGKPPAHIGKILAGAIDKGDLTLPCVGFSETHRGKPLFCWTKEDLAVVEKVNASRKKDAIKIDYFRSLLQGTEYRIHVFRDEALCAEVKTLSADPVKATATSLLSKLTRRATKNEVPLSATQEELQFVVESLAGDLTRGPSHLQKSVQHGWELSETPLGDVPAEVIAAAINSLDAAGLDAGAVSVVFEENTALVGNIITAPGLSDDQLTMYVDAIKEFTGKKDGASAKKVKKVGAVAGEPAASQEIIAKLTRKVRLGKISQAAAEEMLKALE